MMRRAALAALLLPGCALAQVTEADPSLTEVWTPVPAKVAPGAANEV